MKSCLIDKLEPNDDYKADGGFNIRHLDTKRRATLNILPLSRRVNNFLPRAVPKQEGLLL